MTDVSRRERRMQHKMQQQQTRTEQQKINDRRRRNKTIINYSIISLLLVAIVYGGFALLKRDDAPGQYDSFAQCLTQKGAAMYGTDWCPHCQAQKKLFGNSFKYVNYINCDANKAACDAAGVKGYPTWQFPRGDPVSGTQELATLAERAGCVL